MAHELERREDGSARMMYAGKAPWHGLGTKVEKEVTAEAAIRLAGLDWEVEKRPIYIAGTNEVDGIKVIGNEVPDRFAVVRKEDDRVLGVVGSAYTPIQNVEAFAFLDSLVGEGLAMYHTAGSIFGGRKVFITCKLPDSIEIGPDQVDKYLALATAHDGSMMMHVKWTPIRVVCWNTMSAAFQIDRGTGKARAQDSVSILYRGNYKDYIAEAREMLNLTNFYYSRLEDCFNRLRETKIRECDWTRFANRLIPDEPKPNGKVVDRSKLREQLTHLYHHGIGNEHPDVKGTKWAAYSAVTEFVDHTKNYGDGDKGSAEDYRMNAIVWGNGSAVKKKALEMLATN